jgi:hypothetical protein
MLCVTVGFRVGRCAGFFVPRYSSKVILPPSTTGTTISHGAHRSSPTSKWHWVAATLQLTRSSQARGFRWPRTPWSLQATKQSIHFSHSRHSRIGRLASGTPVGEHASTDQGNLSRFASTRLVIDQPSASPEILLRTESSASHVAHDTTDGLAGTSVVIVPYTVGNRNRRRQALGQRNRDVSTETCLGHLSPSQANATNFVPGLDPFQ